MKSGMFTLLIFLLMVLGQVALAADEAIVTEDDATDVEVSSPAAVEDSVLLIVNGKPIMQSEIDAIVNPQIAMVQQVGQEVSANDIISLRQRVLQSLITDILVDGAIKENNIVITDEDVDNKLKEIAERQQMTIEELMKDAEEHGENEASVRKDIKEQMPFEKLLMTKAGKDAFVVTDEDAKKFYDESPDIFNLPASVKASHILAGGEGYHSSNEEQKKEMRKKIEAIQKKLKDGASFEDIAKEESDCPSGADGGDLKVYMEPDGKIVDAGPGDYMDKTFTDAAFKLEVGEVSDIVETQFGFHIIKTTDKKEAKVVNYEEEKPKIKDYLKRNKINDFAQEYLQGLAAEADITVPDMEEPEEASAEEVEIAPVTAEE